VRQLLAVELVALRRVAPRRAAQRPSGVAHSVRSTRTGLSQRDKHHLQETEAPCGVRWQSEAATALWLGDPESKAASRCACRRTPYRRAWCRVAPHDRAHRKGGWWTPPARGGNWSWDVL